MTQTAPSTSRNSPTRILTHRERQMVAVFVFIARRCDLGATRIEVARHLGLSAPYITKLLNEMVERRFLLSRQCWEQPRAPWRYWTPADAYPRPRLAVV